MVRPGQQIVPGNKFLNIETRAPKVIWRPRFVFGYQHEGLGFYKSSRSIFSYLY